MDQLIHSFTSFSMTFRADMDSCVAFDTNGTTTRFHYAGGSEVRWETTDNPHIMKRSVCGTSGNVMSYEMYYKK